MGIVSFFRMIALSAFVFAGAAVQADQFRGVSEMDLVPEALASLEVFDVQVGADVSADDQVFYNFGHVRVNTSRTARFRITNVGPSYLPFYRAQMSGSYDFSARHDCSRGLHPNEACFVDVYFRPHREGHRFSTIHIEFHGDSVIFDVRGYGRRW